MFCTNKYFSNFDAVLTDSTASTTPEIPLNIPDVYLTLKFELLSLIFKSSGTFLSLFWLTFFANKCCVLVFLVQFY